jgi:hypothetical protein
MTQPLGDHGRVHILQENNAIVRREVSTTRGRQVKHRATA